MDRLLLRSIFIIAACEPATLRTPLVCCLLPFFLPSVRHCGCVVPSRSSAPVHHSAAFQYVAFPRFILFNTYLIFCQYVAFKNTSYPLQNYFAFGQCSFPHSTHFILSISSLENFTIPFAMSQSVTHVPI